MAFNLKKFLGQAADAIIPGDQSGWHQNPPAPQPASTAQPQRSVVSRAFDQVNPFDGGKTFNNPGSTAAPQQKPLWQKALQNPGQAIDNVIPGNQDFLHQPLQKTIQQVAPKAPEISLQAAPTVLKVITQGPAMALTNLVGNSVISKAANVAQDNLPTAIEQLPGQVQPAAKLIDQTLLTPALKTTERVSAAATGANPYSAGKQGVGERVEDLANVVSLFPGVGELRGAVTAGNLVKTGLKTAPLGAAVATGKSLQNNDNPSDLFKNALIGAGLAGAGGAVAPAIAPAAKALSRGVRQDATAGSPILQSQVGAIGNDVRKVADNQELPIVGPKLTTEPKMASNKFTGGVQTSPEVSPEVQAMVSGQHAVRNTQQLSEDADTLIKNQGIEKATQSLNDSLSVPDGQITDSHVANAIKIAKANDANGNHDAAASIYDQLGDHLVAAGQTVQAASLLARRTPEGLQFAGQRALKKAGVTPAAEVKKALQDALNSVKATKEGTPERDRAVSVYRQLVGKQLPSDAVDKGLGIWKAGLLTGAKTFAGAPFSNITFGGLKALSDIPATGFDKAISLATGERTKTLTPRGLLKGSREGFDAAKDYLKSGYDATNDSAKYEQSQLNFKNKALDTYVNGVFRAMGALDKPTRYAALRNSLADQAKAAAINQGVRGAERKSFIDNFITDPPPAALQKATDEAVKSVLGNDTVLKGIVSGAKRQIENIENPAARAVGKTAIGVAAPFSGVPSAFLSRALDFTPVGGIKEVVSQLAKHKFDQRDLVQALGEATTGSAVIYLGSELASNGLLSGDYPKDAKEQARWNTEGIKPNSVKIGDNWYSLNYLGPLGLLFGAGKNAVDAAKEGNNEALASIAGFGRGALNQSFLQGVSGIVDAINDPQRSGASFARNQTASLVPSGVRDAAELFDPLQRNTAGGILGVGNAVANRIPGLRNTLTPKQDAFGNDLQKSSDAINTAVNPLKPSKDVSTPLTQELDRLKGTDKENFVFPTPDKTIKVGSETIKLDDKQQSEFNKYTGQQIQKKWNEIISDDGYKQLSDAEKAKVLRSAMQDVNAVSKAQYLTTIGRDDLAKQAGENLSGTQRDILMGSILTAGDYTAKAADSSGSGSTTKVASNISPDSKSVLQSYNKLGTEGKKQFKADPKNAYKLAAAQYENDVAGGKYNDVQKQSKEKALAKQAITSDYSEEVNSFYGLSNADKSAYFKRDPEKAKDLYEKAKELSSRLAGAGMSSKTISTSTGKSSGGKSSGKKSSSKGGAKKGKYNYAQGLAATNATALKNQSALRSLIKKSKITRKKIKV